MIEKSEIEKNIVDGNFDIAKKLIEGYKEQNQNDFEINSIEGAYYFALNDLEKAEESFLNGLRKNPFNFDLNLNLAILYEINQNLSESVKYYYRSFIINNTCNLGKDDDKEIFNKYVKLGNQLSEIYESSFENGNQSLIAEMVETFNDEMEMAFGLHRIAPWGWGAAMKPIGDTLKTNKKYFCAEYSKIGFNNESQTKTYSKVEIRKIRKIGTNWNFDFKEENLLAITAQEHALVKIIENGKETEFFVSKNNFSYFKLKGKVEIYSEKNLIFSEPIKLILDDNKKRLVLNIFIDGLSKKFLEENGFEKSMPKTAKFFDKSIHFNDMFTVGEWTYPTMASFYSGVYTTKHKMFHPTLDNAFSKENKILTEYLKEKGYSTTTINGTWRMNPDYGYIKGVDRSLNATYGEVFSVNELISEAIESIELMKETNHFLHINIAELHDIADNYKLPVSVQKKLATEFKQDGRTNGTTSVKQKFSLPKKEQYKEQLLYIDRYLGFLYSYLEENFREDEILINFHSDHGQAFLVKSEMFLDEEITKIPLFIKGVTKERLDYNNPVSGVDFIAIMSRILDFEIDLKNKDCKLPEIFLKNNDEIQKREYTISESIFPGDTYKMAIHSKDIYFYFESIEKTTYDGRVDIKEYKTILMDRNRNIIKNDEIEKEFIEYIKDHLKDLLIY